jgi:hypothetical protein
MSRLSYASLSEALQPIPFRVLPYPGYPLPYRTIATVPLVAPRVQPYVRSPGYVTYPGYYPGGYAGYYPGAYAGYYPGAYAGYYPGAYPGVYPGAWGGASSSASARATSSSTSSTRINV